LAQPVITVVVSTDYASGTAAGWNDLRSTLAGLARQDFQEPAEFLLVETTDLASQIPPDLCGILPSLRIVTAPAIYANELKNAGARASTADLVAMLDGDCTPARGWLRHLVTALREHPDVSVVSGRTTYGRRRLLDRAMALATRSHLDPGRTAPAHTPRCYKPRPLL
jgi:cellulose synthase/poly-beta-1,6-N-acetylglucosamine synthase-like glycosyltransferase